MACCKCCCGNKNCDEGEIGKCCCGGPTGSCCTASQYCCSGTCQSTPCGGACCDPVFGCGQVADEATCTEAGGVWQGIGVPCDPDPCCWATCDNYDRDLTPFEWCYPETHTTLCGSLDKVTLYEFPCSCVTENPTNTYDASISDCSDWAEGADYPGCSCVAMVSSCSKLAKSGNCVCAKFRYDSTFQESLFLWRQADCQWQKIATLAATTSSSVVSRYGYPGTEGCVHGAGGNIPEDPSGFASCTPQDCSGPFTGSNCDCNPLP